MSLEKGQGHFILNTMSFQNRITSVSCDIAAMHNVQFNKIITMQFGHLTVLARCGDDIASYKPSFSSLCQHVKAG